MSHLIDALKAIRDYSVEDFDFPQEEWDKHTPETCEECKRWRDMKHPLQHHCDGWYRLFYSRERRNNEAQLEQHWAMRRIARAAIEKAEGE